MHPPLQLRDQTQLGVLVIVVLRGRHLPDRHTRYKQSPYVKLHLSNESEATSVDTKGGQHPFWDSELRFPIYADFTRKENRVLIVECWARQSKKEHDDFLGAVEVDVAPVLRTGEFDDWADIGMGNGVKRGQIYLEMTFFASGAPPAHHPTQYQPHFPIPFTTGNAPGRQQSLPMSPHMPIPSTITPPHHQRLRSSSLPNPRIDNEDETTQEQAREPRKRLRKSQPPQFMLAPRSPCRVSSPCAVPVIAAAHHPTASAPVPSQPGSSDGNSGDSSPVKTPPTRVRPMSQVLSTQAAPVMKDLPPIPASKHNDRKSGTAWAAMINPAGLMPDSWGVPSLKAAGEGLSDAFNGLMRWSSPSATSGQATQQKVDSLGS